MTFSGFLISAASLLFPALLGAQCTYNPALSTITITYCWANGMDGIVVTPSGFPSTAPLQTAMTNWSNTIGNWTVCGVVQFYFSAPHPPYSYYGNIDVAYTSISSPDPTKTIRGQTDLSDAATINYNFGTTPPIPMPRIVTVGMKINPIVTSNDAISEVFAHEIGHTFALNDCNTCGLNSTVMESNDSVPSPNTLIGLPGPTNNDVHYIVQLTGGEYTCPGWSYPTCQP